MKVGIVSDLHGRVPDSVKQALAGCDQILCAGDLQGEDVLADLSAIAPTVAVRGNTDDEFNRYQDLPLRVEGEVGGVGYLMVHERSDAVPIPAGVRLVVFGHTHEQLDEEVDGVRFVNPGSPTRPRGDDGPSCALMTVEDGEIEDVYFFDLLYM